MFPYVQLGEFLVPVNLLMHVLAIALSIALLNSRHPDEYPGRWLRRTLRHTWIVFAATAGAVVGGFIFHFIFVNHGSGDWNAGRMFYGSLAGYTLVSWLITRKMSESRRDRYLNSAALVGAMDYGWIRLGCFAAGCCWGRMTDLPWAVVYEDPHTTMPFQGVPVHPVQVYDSLLGFFLFGFLYLWQRRGGNAFAMFFLLYPVGRFVTELFRGDKGRGVDVIFGLSNSQALSVALFGGMLTWFLVSYVRRGSFSQYSSTADGQRPT